MTEKRKQVLGSEVQVRDFVPADIAPLVNYWTESSEEFWKVRGVDKSKLKSREEFISVYEKLFKEEGSIPTMATILLRGVPVGTHTLTSLVPNESAVFHAHIWQEDNRRQGISVYSYLLASEFFMNKLSIKKLLFKTPKINLGAHRVKEKIGIPALGDTVFESPVLFSPLPAIFYELDRELLLLLKRKHGV